MRKKTIAQKCAPGSCASAFKLKINEKRYKNKPASKLSKIFPRKQQGGYKFKHRNEYEGLLCK
jgi:hypothetical protein